jgi:peptidoglycan/LPS O-acetylase OafA/YrhL
VRRIGVRALNRSYGLTSLGHEAVVLFFVLSGYWVGGSALRKIERSTFSWRSYLLDRVVRLWVVLIPVLVLTAVIGLLGNGIFSDFAQQAGGPYQGDSTILGFVGNALFLGSIHLSTFGTNTPLWSLGYEFWMYILGPLVLLVFRAPKNRTLLYILCTIAVAFLVGLPVFEYLPIWMAGVLVAYARVWLEDVGWKISPLLLTGIRGAALLCALAVAIAGRTVFHLPTWLSDFVFAVPVIVLLASLLPDTRRRTVFTLPLTQFSKLAHSSFSLYAIHMPILLFIVSALGVSASERWPADIEHWSYLALVVAGVVVFGWLLGQVTEKYTNRVRGFTRKILRLS